MITQERLKELVKYDEVTGLFTRIVTRPGLAQAGSVAGFLHKSSGYWLIKVDGRAYGAHRLAWLYVTGEWPSFEVDHKDLNRARNVWTNLRKATHSENVCNASLRSDNATGVKGVSICSSTGKFKATISKLGDFRYLGIFVKLEDAAAAVAVARESMHGEFARAA